MKLNDPVAKLKLKSIQRKKRKRRILLLISVMVIILLSSVTTFYKLKNTYAKEKANKEINTSAPNKEPEKEISKDDDLVKGSNVTNLGNKFAIEAETVREMVNGKYEGDEKYVFLTFDDGPSPNTEKILDILKEKDVKGTFFVLGDSLQKSDSAKEYLKRALKEGHAIGNHSYTHNFKKLYPNNKLNIDVFMKEFNQTNNLIRSVVGEDFNTRVLRMPGGYNSRIFYKDPSLTEFNNILNENNIVNIDWNALNGDAEGRKYTSQEMLNYAIKSSEEQNQIIILMHDTYGKEKTVQMLPALIDYYKSNGYEFKTIK